MEDYDFVERCIMLRRAYFEISKLAREVVRRVNMKMLYGTENLPNVRE